MNDIDSLIFSKFKVRENDTLPFKTKGTRDMLAQLMGELGFKTGAEIGVWRGGFSRVMCDSMPGLKLKCIDPWVAFDDHSIEESESNYIKTCSRLKPYNVEIIRKKSMEAVLEVEDRSLDFVYLDEQHDFDIVVMNLILWSTKVKQGGIFSGRDYTNNFYRYGVIPAVDAYTRAHIISKWYVTNERDSSYFWVNQ
jgi:hypothetical protein